MAETAVVSQEVVLAKRQYETWFLAAAESIAGCRGLADNIPAPADPESIRNAKGWLTRHMSPGRSYRPTGDQPALTRVFDLQQARIRCPSFDKLRRTIDELLR